MSATVSRPGVPSARSASSWLLVGLVLISLLGMHFLSGRDAAGHHRVLVPATITSPVVPAGDAGTRSANDPSPAALPATPPAADAAGVTEAPGITEAPANGSVGHRITVIGCVLLLLVGLGTALSRWLRRRSVGDRTTAKWCALQGTVRGPPKALARLVLCVERT